MKKTLKLIPGVDWFWSHANTWCKTTLLRLKKTEDVFTDIYEKNYWGDIESASGPGSNMEETKVIRQELSHIVSSYRVLSLLDIPCGDFHWLKEANLGEVSYIGADIVNQLIDNNKRYENSHRQFVRLNILKDRLPQVDLILVRDCLVHFSYSDIAKAVDNICASGSKYLLATTFPDKENNINIATGQWFPLNLQIAPFFFPQPVLIINENNPEYPDKSLALWRIADIKGKHL